MNKRRRHSAKRRRSAKKQAEMIKRIAKKPRRRSKIGLASYEAHRMSMATLLNRQKPRTYIGDGSVCLVEGCRKPAMRREIVRRGGGYVGACREHVARLAPVNRERSRRFEGRSAALATLLKLKDQRAKAHMQASKVCKFGGGK